MKGTKRRLTKLQNHNLKQRFKQDFTSGRYSIAELAKAYNVGRRKLLKWKHELFGKGSITQRRIFQMHLAGIPSKAIAEFYGVHVFQVHRAIRQERKKYLSPPQQKLFTNHKPKEK